MRPFPTGERTSGGRPARSAGTLGSLATLNAVRTPEPLGRVMDEMTAYILAGSFVQFLIDR
jgi:hypothetical protein